MKYAALRPNQTPSEPVEEANPVLKGITPPDPPRNPPVTRDFSENIIAEHSKIFGRGKPDDQLSEWQKAVNAKALEIVGEKPELMYRRGELKMNAEERARASYIFKKGVSRSQFSTDEKAPKRQKVSADEREHKIISISSDIEILNKQMIAKQNLISKANATKDFQLCDKTYKEIRELMREKGKLEQQLKVLQKKEAKSKWYRKTKPTKESSSTGKGPTVALPPKDAHSSLDIRTLFTMKNAASSGTGAVSLPANTPLAAVATGTLVDLTGSTETDTTTETATSTETTPTTPTETNTSPKRHIEADGISSTVADTEHQEKESLSFLDLEALI